MHSFDNRTISISEFSSCVTSGGRLCQSCSVLQNDSSRDFQHSKQCKYKEKYLSKFSKAHKRKQTSLLAKVNSRCFFPISGRHVGVPQKGTSMASPYKARNSCLRLLSSLSAGHVRFWPNRSAMLRRCLSRCLVSID